MNGACGVHSWRWLGPEGRVNAAVGWLALWVRRFVRGWVAVAALGLAPIGVTTDQLPERGLPGLFLTLAWTGGARNAAVGWLALWVRQFAGERILGAGTIEAKVAGLSAEGLLA